MCRGLIAVIEQVMQPDCIRLNRGNHESRQQNKLMGFEEEVRRNTNPMCV